MPERLAQHPWFDASETPRTLAHRGLVTDAALAAGIVENSFAAVAAAHAAGAVYVESDCHVTRDGVAVLFHDDDLVRVAGDPRRIDQIELRELEQLMAERGGLVSLAQALESFPGVRFNIDVKADAAAETAGTIVGPFADRVLLTSFSDQRRLRALEAALAANPQQRPATSAGWSTVARLIFALTIHSRRGVAAALDGVDALQLPERHGALRVVSPRLLEAAHRHGVEVHVWTVNEPDDMRRLVALGVDGIVTDRAADALALLKP
ncbi:glycerophosphodiester phosphodiesterase family protein [Microbacterium sp. NPDC076911]|uniref:glycerophosphodiester phosphodiesterase family protein n=1 Tax=Microbacterium sp. NPDC076911 TaxID=3154958 RepID=UPI0034370596